MLENLHIHFQALAVSAPEINHGEGGLQVFRSIAMKNAQNKSWNAFEKMRESPSSFGVTSTDLVKDLGNIENQKESLLLSYKGTDKNRVSPDRVILGADTIVVYNDQILPKPKSPEDAEEMLLSLSGNTHHVITGAALTTYPEGRILLDYEETRVKFRQLSQEDIKCYVSSGEYADKAGAYGIQGYGVFLVESIEGDYSNVVGLPLMKLYRMFKELDIDLLKTAVSSNKTPLRS